VFIHTWDRLDHLSRTWHNSADTVGAATAVESSIQQRVIEYFNPKKFKIEAQDFIDEQGYFGTHDTVKIGLGGIKYMLYSKYQVNQLRLEYSNESGVAYDYCVMIRPDIMPLTDLDVEKFKPFFEFDPSTSIHFAFSQFSDLRGERFFTFNGAFDLYYFARPEIISKICECYLHFDRYYKDMPAKIFPRQVEVPELAFYEFILKMGVMPRVIRSYFSIKRKNPLDDLTLAPPIEGLEQNTIRLAEIQHSNRHKVAIQTLSFIKRLLPYRVRLFLQRCLRYAIRVFKFIEARTV
jgi:hypothetical protein